LDVAQASVTVHGQARRTALSGMGRAFPRNHAPDIAAMDLFIAPTSVCDQFIDAHCQLLLLAMLGHTGPICIIPVGVVEVAARLKGSRARRAGWIAGPGGRRAG